MLCILNKFRKLFSIYYRKNISQIQFSVKTEQLNIKKNVYISESTDIYTNLALEEWFYKNYDFSHNHLLMIWRNDPCVVVGRHQNPWIEANIPEMVKNGIILARRNSGGGTVYQDPGNLNLTFFTSRKLYNRINNLKLIIKALDRKYGLTTASISSKDDLIVRNKYKFSGTAAKLGQPNAYHHCTILVNADKLLLQRCLQKRKSFIETNATKSVLSPVINLIEECSKVTMESLIQSIAEEYLLDVDKKKICSINANDQEFPGISEIRLRLSDWNWCFGKTPDFSINRTFFVPSNTTLISSIIESKNSVDKKLNVTMKIKKGRIENIFVKDPPQLEFDYQYLNDDFKFVLTVLKERKFTDEAISVLESCLEEKFMFL